jgi:hypothetical protein
VGYQPFDSLQPILDAWVSGEMSVNKQVEEAQFSDADETPSQKTH